VTRAADRRKRLVLRSKLATLTTLPNVAPTTTRDILAAEIASPMRGGNQELPHVSLFGDSHLQRNLF
jgi:hypothetical protein